MAQSVGRGIALPFHERGTRRGGWSAARPGRTLPSGEEPVPILQEAGWAPEPVWAGGKSRPHRDSIPDRPARSAVAIRTELLDPRTKEKYRFNYSTELLTDFSIKVSYFTSPSC